MTWTTLKKPLTELTFSTAADLYLKDVIRRELCRAANTRSSLNTLKRYIGDPVYLPLEETALEKLTQDLCTDGYASSTVRKLVSLCIRVLRFIHVYSGAPYKAYAVTLPKVKHRTRILTLDEITSLKCRLKDTYDERLIAFGNLLIHTGLRAGEALSLRWCDNSYLTCWEVRRLKTKTKTKLNLEKSVHDELYKFRFFAPDTSLVFKEKYHRGLLDQLRLLINVVCNNNDEIVLYLGKATIHTLRHTFATRALEAGIPLPIVSYTMGHSNLEMTQKYTHILNNKEVERKALHTSFDNIYN